MTLSSPSTLLVPLLLFVIRCEFSVPYLNKWAFCTRHRRVLGTSKNSYNGDKLYRAAINLRNAINIPSVRCLYIPIPIRCLCVCHPPPHHNYRAQLKKKHKWASPWRGLCTEGSTWNAASTLIRGTESLGDHYTGDKTTITRKRMGMVVRVWRWNGKSLFN